ncbi:MAG: peptidylprolyl isomerase [Planctomycetota bacterium]
MKPLIVVCSRQSLAMLALALLLTGCTSDKQQGAPSMVDRLADAEQMQASLKGPVREEPAATPPSGSTPDPSVSAKGSFKVKFESSSGDFVVLVHREWAPTGAQRFYELVKDGFYDECRYFRVVPGFMVQFGINGNPDVSRRWDRNIRDDEPTQSNKRGYVTFATSGPDSRTTQIFVNYADNAFLDQQGFAPFGEVIEGMQNVDAIFSGYGERPNQGALQTRGNTYLSTSFPELDYVRKATVIAESEE